ncbi:hypothetical protein AC477_02370 [miscellaneous Crenarchaeota group-1 archaeon SG8-32-1]|uniref:Metal-dependent enzyme n=1 Tax=miscellaneous Crenarchaeota group-1 archaeon SG8-32-1 TaxID=1685124 RepID=A0A0M0BW51_9ARCH|nr:MAG: hypothetical protein AC477_02370 [miscellaneous Crenarchaeota group-1 archaeon SG8-32-1]
MSLADKKNKEPSLAFGGQAVMEGVMMRSKDNLVICVRQPNQEIVTKTEKLRSLSQKYKILKIPFIRGILALFETLYSGVKGIYFSANATFGDENEEVSLSPKEIAITVVFSFFLSVLIFSVTPFFLTGLLNLGQGVVFSITEGIIRIGFLLGYLAVVSMLKDFKRILQYHGAEHASINAYEAGVELNVENVRTFSRFHPRCGTSFLLIVSVVSILFFSIISSPDYLTRLSYRIILIPAISSVSYELLRISDRYKKSIIVRALVAPGIFLQRFTTRQPDDGMIEVAIKALKEVETMQLTNE